ncbi:hypothetical protein ACQJBY_027905 [Aegilops geniculata]
MQSGTSPRALLQHSPRPGLGRVRSAAPVRTSALRHAVGMQKEHLGFGGQAHHEVPTASTVRSMSPPWTRPAPRPWLMLQRQKSGARWRSRGVEDLQLNSPTASSMVGRSRS